jgi:hypothetical protein
MNKSSMIKINIVTCMLLVVFISSCSRVTSLSNPPIIALPAGIELEKLSSIIEKSIINRGWVIVEKKDDSMIALLLVRQHSLTVIISYTQEGILIKYKDSEVLLYSKDDEGNETIHKKYNTWITNLVNDIKKGMYIFS